MLQVHLLVALVLTLYVLQNHNLLAKLLLELILLVKSEQIPINFQDDYFQYYILHMAELVIHPHLSSVLVTPALLEQFLLQYHQHK